MSLRSSVDAVIASEAKQSMEPLDESMDCFVASLLAMTMGGIMRLRVGKL